MKRFIAVCISTVMISQQLLLASTSGDSIDRFAYDTPEQSSFHYQDKKQLAFTELVDEGLNKHGERPIVVVVCTYNNEEWAEKNIDSIFSQNYRNVRAIIVDDCSSDNNVKVIQAYIDKHKLADRVTFICNKKRMRKLSNLYKVLYACKDNEIVLMLDGDDWFEHKNVLQFINKQYSDPDTWFTYGQYRNVPVEEAIKLGHREIGYCRPVPEKIKKEHACRKYSFIYMHPRSYRAWLFKQIKLEDLIAETVSGFEGDFYPASNDNAMYFPMVEMAHSHVVFIPEILYVRNFYNEIVGLKVDRKLQIASSREIRNKPSYPVLHKPLMRDADLQELSHAQVDFFMLMRDGLRDIEKKIDVTYGRINHINMLYVFYPGTEENKSIARRMIKRYKNVHFVPFYPTGNVLKNRLLESIMQSTQDYILLADDRCEVIDSFDLSQALYWLERTQAHRFYLQRSLNQENVSRFVELDDTVCAWKFLVGSDMWRGVTSLRDMTLCKKAMLISELNMLSFGNIDELDREMQSIRAPLSKVGLCFMHEKIRRHD